MEVLEDILTNQPAGRLYRGLVASGLASSVSGVAFSWAEPGVMEFTAQVAEGQAPESVLGSMIDIIEGLDRTPITEREVELAVARQKKMIKLSMNDSSRLGIRMSEFIAQGDWRLFFLHRDRIEKVTVADVRAAADKYLVETNRTAGMFIPTEQPSRTTVPDRPDVAEMVQGYQGQAMIAEGEELLADVDHIESRVIRKNLAGGIKLALLPVERRGDDVQATFRVHFGSEEALTGKTTAASFIPEMLMRGTKSKNYEQLRNEIDRLQSRISVSGRRAVDVMSGSIQSDREHFLPAIQLLAEIFQQPAFAAEEFEIIKKRRRADIESGLSDPRTLGMTAMSRAMHPWPADSIHYVPTLEEELERLEATTLEQVQQLYNELVGGSYLEIAVVGDFEPDQVTQEIEQSFASWKSPAPYRRVAEAFRDVTADRIKIDTPDKEMAMVVMSSVVKMNDEDPRYPAMVMASYVLGRSAKSRLLNRLRHQGGLSYSAFGNFSADSQDERGGLMAMAICAPQNADKALAAMREEIAAWIEKGITDEELAEAQTSYELKFKSSLASERYLLDEIAEGLELDRTLQFRAELLEKIKALTPADIRAALQDVLGKAAMIEIQAGDPAPTIRKIPG